MNSNILTSVGLNYFLLIENFIGKRLSAKCYCKIAFLIVEALYFVAVLIHLQYPEITWDFAVGYYLTPDFFCDASYRGCVAERLVGTVIRCGSCI